MASETASQLEGILPCGLRAVQPPRFSVGPQRQPASLRPAARPVAVKKIAASFPNHLALN